MLDMMPTLISCKRECLPMISTENISLSPARENVFPREKTCLPREVEHLGEAEVGVGEVAFHLAIPANLSSRWWSHVCA